MEQILVKTISVPEIIQQQSAYEALGEILRLKIEIILKSEKKPILLILDFTNLNLLTYGFIEIALIDLVNYTKSHNDVLVFYEINQFELSELITGIIDLLRLQSKNENRLNEVDLLKNHYSIAHKTKDSHLQYIGSFNEVENIILKIIENKGKITYNEINDFLKESGKLEYCEEITKSIDHLFSLGFIYVQKSEGSPSYYYSLNYLQNDAN